jgi:hypothetical protein
MWINGYGKKWMQNIIYGIYIINQAILIIVMNAKKKCEI